MSCCCCESRSVGSGFLRPHGLYSPWNSPGQNTGMGSLFFSRGSSQPRDWTQSPALWAESLPAEPQGKPKNTGVGSLFQWISLTQESNQGLLHCTQILYQLTYQRSPYVCMYIYNSILYIGLHYSAMIKEDTLSFVTTWTVLEQIMLNEISQRKTSAM